MFSADLIVTDRQRGARDWQFIGNRHWGIAGWNRFITRNP